MDIDDYLAAKAAAAAARVGPKPTEGAAAAPSAPPVQGAASCNGLGQNAPVTGGSFNVPPDTHGAVGPNHFVQIVNRAIRVYTKALTANCPSAILLNVGLGAFFGYTTQPLFDPRVVYDKDYDRWIVSAEGFPQTDGQQFQFVAVSQTPDAAGSYFVYGIEQSQFNGGAFWDFPQLGYDEEAIIVTGNLFNPGYVNSQVLFLPKARMYRGLSFSFCSPNLGAEGTVAPPIVLDQSPFTVLATPRTGTNTIRLTKYTGTSRVCPTFVEQADIPSTFSVPPSAPQPGTCPTGVPSCLLDTSDARFVNASTQFGQPAFGQTIRLWNTHTVDLSGFAAPRYYQFNANLSGPPGANTIEDTCHYFRSSSSDDFNASIAANGNGDVFITWSATDVPNSINPEVRFTGKKFADPCSTLGAGTANNTSVNPLTGNFDPNFGTQRWGDYSAVTIDPSVTSRAWAVNEKVQSSADPTTWKSRFFNMDNP
jgi:hypothetical protein